MYWDGDSYWKLSFLKVYKNKLWQIECYFSAMFLNMVIHKQFYK